MLEQLVNEIRAGGTLATGVLAVRLGTTPQLIEAMLGHLQRSGLKDACQTQTPGTLRLWQSKSEG